MKKRRIFLTVVGIVFFLIFTSCAEKQLTLEENKKLDEVRARSYEFVKEATKDGFKADAYGEESHYEIIVKKYKDIFDKENIKIVQKGMAVAKDPEERKKLDYLRVYLMDGYIGQETAKYGDQMNKLTSEAILIVDKDTIPYRHYSYVMAYEPDREKRKEISFARIPIIAQQDSIIIADMAKTDTMLKEFGYKTQKDFLQDYRLANFDQFAEVCKEFISSTDSLYFALFKEYAPKFANVSADSFRSWDFALLYKGAKFDKYFPKENLVSNMKKTLLGLGIDLDKQKALTLDTEERPKKEPRAATYPVSIPDDIRINLKPIGGQDDYDGFAHEMGHAQHALASKETGFEFNYLGNNTVTETYAFLMEYLMDDPNYLKEHFKFTPEDLKDFIRYRGFIRLLMTRIYCGDFLYERYLYTNDPNLKEEYAKIEQPILGYQWVQIDSLKYLLSGDHFYSADYLRAWFLEAQLKKVLQEKFGEKWFESPEAGDYLKSLWATSSRWTGDELVQQIGVGKIDPKALKDEITWMARFGE
jgi:hypothetical protein